MILKKKNIRNAARMIIAGYLLSIFGLVVVASTETAAVETPEVSKKVEVVAEEDLISIPVQFTEVVYQPSYNKDKCKEHLIMVNETVKQISDSLEDKESYTEAAVLSMNHEYSRLIDIKNQLELELEQYTKWEQEYYYAAKTFDFLLAHGYSREVACGIIGNMMIETSGGTLSLKPNIYNPSGKYYGLCQWNHSYGLHGKSFEQQLNFLISNIEREFNVFGKCYKTDFEYEDFKSIIDPAEAALAFAKVYERCSSASHKLRQQAALDAYNYFNLNNNF